MEETDASGSGHRSPELLYEKAEPRPVSSFESNYGGASPHNYPGERPDTSFLTDTGNVLGTAEPMVYPMRATVGTEGKLQVEVKLGDNRLGLDEILDKLGQPGMN